YMLEGVPSDPGYDPALVKWEDGKKRAFVVPASGDDADHSWIVRFDVCYTASTATARLVHVVHVLEGTDVFTPDPDDCVGGLAQAITGDFSHLLIDLRSRGGKAFLARGVASGNFVVASPMTTVAGKYVPENQLVLAGRFTQGDYVNADECDGATPFTWAFVL